jgi:Predicted nucleotide-binding protein containing TIR-like domain
MVGSAVSPNRHCAAQQEIRILGGMDFVEWCGVVLQRLAQASRAASGLPTQGFSQDELVAAVYDAAIVDEARRGRMLGAVWELTGGELLERSGSLADPRVFIRVTRAGRAAAEDITPLWEQLCDIQLDESEAQLLHVVNRLSHQETDPPSLVRIGHEQVLQTLGWHHWAEAYEIAKELQRLRLVHSQELPGPDGTLYADFYATYRGLVWETRRGFTSHTRSKEPSFGGGERGNASMSNDSLQEPPPLAEDTRAIFVVHGRDGAAVDALFAFLRALDLHPLEWSELIAATGHGTPYVGDVLDTAFRSAQAVLVLLTPDDEVRLHPQLWSPREPSYEREFTLQSRPNVLFEAGMAMGRAPSRTVLIELGEVRPFSDVAGRHMLRSMAQCKGARSWHSVSRPPDAP